MASSGEMLTNFQVDVYHEDLTEIYTKTVSADPSITLEGFMDKLMEDSVISDLTFEGLRLVGQVGESKSWLGKVKEGMTLANYIEENNLTIGDLSFGLVGIDEHHELLTFEVSSMSSDDFDEEGSDEQGDDEKKSERDSESDDDGGHQPPPSAGALVADSSTGYPSLSETFTDKSLEELEKMEKSFKEQRVAIAKKQKELRCKISEVKEATRKEREALKRKERSKAQQEEDATDRDTFITLNIRPTDMEGFTVSVKKGSTMRTMKLRVMRHIHPDIAEEEKKLIKKAKKMIFKKGDKTIEFDDSSHRTTIRNYPLVDGDVISLSSIGSGGAPVRKTLFKPKVLGSGSFAVDDDKSDFDLSFATALNVSKFKKMDFENLLKDCDEHSLNEMKKFWESDRSKTEVKLVKTAEFMKSFKDMNKIIGKLTHSSDYLRDLVCESVLDKCENKMGKAKDAVVRGIDIALAIKKEKDVRDDMEL